MSGPEEQSRLASVDLSSYGGGSSSYGPADTGQGWGSEGSRGYDPSSHVILCLEFLPDGITRALILLQRFVLVAATGLLIWELVTKLHADDRYLIETNDLVYVNITISSACLVVLLCVGCLYALRIMQAKAAGKQWSLRRKRIVILYSTELAVQITNLACFLVPNAYVLSVPCGWFMLPVHVFGTIRWSCWAALFFLSTVHAHNLTPVDSPTNAACCGLLPDDGAAAESRQDALVSELPWCVHLPKLLLLWLPYQVTVIILPLTITGVIGSAVQCSSIDDPRCYNNIDPSISNCRNRVWECATIPLVRTVIYILVALSLLIIFIYLLLVLRAWRELGRRSYARYRVANVHLRIMFQTRLHSYVFLLLCIAILWLIKMGSCTCYMQTWMGFPAMQLVASGLVVFNTICTMPVSPSERQFRLHMWLQDFAWLEADVPANLRRRRAPTSEPMFCFEMALKLMYWSHFVYLREAAADAALPTALGLYRLHQYEVFWARRHDTKAVVAWGEGLILVAFRGTCSLANWLADLQAWRAVHPPKRGSYWLCTQPLVHRGFLQCYKAGGLNYQVLGKVAEILKAGRCSSQGSGGGGSGAEEGQAWRVILTGHSLGGALATLAAFELTQHLAGLADCPPVRVSLYTYGSPRPGNHAFAREFIQRVPDSWAVIHSDDAVASQGKFLVLYKCAAHRVILTAQGDLMVRPSFIEASVRRSAAPSIPQHLLATYGRTMAAVIRGQFRRHKGQGGGREAVQQLLGCQYVQTLLHSAAGFRADSLERLRGFSTADSSGESVGTDLRPRQKFTGGLDSMELEVGGGQQLPEV